MLHSGLRKCSLMLLLGAAVAGCTTPPRVDDATFSGRDGFCTRGCVNNHSACMAGAWWPSTKDDCVNTLNMCVLSCPERQP